MRSTLELLPAAACEPLARLDRSRLGDAFELACLVRATSLTPDGECGWVIRVARPRRPGRSSSAPSTPPAGWGS
ncbi:hypothetical protein ACFQZ4_48180 [Catellatospora coxensis]